MSNNLKTFSNKSNAKRGLAKIGTAALQAASKLLVELEEGKWGFDMDAAEAVQNGKDFGETDGPAITPVVIQKPAPVVPAAAVTVVKDGKKQEPKPAPAPVVTKAEQLLKEEKCPLCGADPSSQTWANEGVSLYCHSCCKTYSLATGKEVRTGYTRPNAPKGYTIDKDRPVQNGVKRPSAGTVCGQVWAEFDKDPSIQAKDLAALAEKNGWNKNNVSCEFYAWRKFNGIKGRQA